MSNQNSSRLKSSVNNIIFGLGFKIICMLFPFIIKSIIIWKLGVQYLGLNSLFASIISVLSLTELGIGSALVYAMYQPIAESDTKKACALLNFYKRVYRIIGFIILGIGVLLLPFIKFFIKGSYPADVNLYILFGIYIFDTVISYFMFSYKYAILEVNQRNSVESIIHSITSLAMYIFQIVVLILFKNYYLYLILLPISTIALNIIRNIVVNRLYPDLKCVGDISKSEKREIFKKVKALIGHKIGTTVITSADSIVISSFLGLNVLAIYSNYYMIINTLIGFITILYNSIQATVGNILVTETQENITKYFNYLTLINGWVVGYCSVLFICLIQPFMRLWMGGEMLFPNHIIFLFAIYFYTWLIRRIGLTFKDAGGLWEEDFLKPYIGSIINIVTNIILVKIIGVEGVLLSTIIVMVFIYFPWETNIINKKIIKGNIKKYIYNILSLTLLTIVSTIVCYLVCNIISTASIYSLIIKATLASILYVVFLLLFYSKSIYKLINVLKKKVV